MREKHTWNVTLQAETGEIVERKVKAFWDPEHELTTDSVGTAAKVAAWLESGKQVAHHPIAVSPVS